MGFRLFYLHEFENYCQQKSITVEQISSELLFRYVQCRGTGLGPNLNKAVVWSLQKFGDYLVLRSILPEYPARLADYMSIFATVDPDAQHDGICAFLVEKDWEGVSVGRKIPKLGQRGSNTTGINLKNVWVPKENVMAPPGEGFVPAMKTFARTRPAIGAFAIGTGGMSQLLFSQICF